ncbi:hypothetical protein BRC86_10315 [Halobacteriales archaeon QS_3_64_16]|nr:MAG: hypothetical protein BRC86_10315 [Halobacteriales archaeon QS_3_64_16]
MLDDDEDKAFDGSITDPTEDLGPEIPSVRIPGGVDGNGDADMDPEVPQDLFVTFWGLVVTLNLALFATSLGLMLAYFRGQLRLGGGLFVLGVLAFAYSYYKYRRYRDRNDASDGEDGSDSEDSDEE